MYKHLIRPILFRFNPEKAHNLTLAFLSWFKHSRLCSLFLRLLFKRSAPALEKEVFGLKFPNPVGLAAGIDKNGEHYNTFSDMGFGFVEIGSLTPKPQKGNPKPRLFRLVKDKAIINRMGINNKGIKNAISQIQKYPPRTILVANIAKNTVSKNDTEVISDYERSFSLMYDFVDMFTINVSCPNVEGLQSLQDISFLSDILDPILDLRLCYDDYKPILVKLSPDIDFQQLDEILDWCMLSGIDGIVAGNTTRSRDNLATDRNVVERIGAGGLSGGPLFSRSLSMVSHIREHTKGKLGIIGVGGIMTPAQASDMLAAGADLIEVATGFIYEGPSFVKNILKYLQIKKKQS